MPLNKETKQNQTGYLTDFPPSRYITQGRFIVGSSALIETQAQLFQKYLVPSVTRYEISPAKQILPGRKAPWGQLILVRTNVNVGQPTKADSI